MAKMKGTFGMAINVLLALRLVAVESKGTDFGKYPGPYHNRSEVHLYGLSPPVYPSRKSVFS